MKKALRILLLEDDTIEIMKLRRTILSLGLNHKVIEARNGEMALKILFSNGELPDVILLDLNMPKINGLEFLKILKKDEKLKFIPTVVLTTSSNDKDVLECYKMGIAGYIIKPLKYKDYVSRIDRVLSYWSINELYLN